MNSKISIPLPAAKTKTNIVASLGVFMAGLLIGLFFFGATLWGHIEASQFEAPPGGDNRLTSLSCPAFVTPNEISYASAWLENPTERPMRRLAFTRITEGSVVLVREIETRIELQPGENYRMVWPITTEDAAWSRFVFLRVNVLRNTPMPSQTGACGVMVANVPWLTGGQLTFLILTLAGLGLGGGLIWWRRLHQPLIGFARQLHNLMLGYTILLMAGTFVVWRGQWMGGAALFAVVLLVTVTVLAWFTLSERKWHELREELYGEG